MAEQILTVTEAAELRGVDPETVRRWCREGFIKGARKAGRVWLMPKAAVLAYEPPSPGPPPKRPKECDR